MPQTRVDIPGVGIVEFPEGMTGEEINAASERLYNESQGELKWPPGEPTGRTVSPSIFRREYQRPEVTPEARAAAAAATPDPRLPTAGEIAAGSMEYMAEPRRREMQERWWEEVHRPLIPMSPTAERLWPRYEGIALPEQVERGVAIGLARLAESFTSPMTIATIGGAMGAGAVSNTLRVLVGMGFTGHLAADAIIQAPEMVKAVEEGRYDDAAATATTMLGTGALAGAIGAHTLKAVRSHPRVTGAAIMPDPRGRPLEPRVYQEGAGLEVLPAHEPLFPGRPTALPGTPAAGALPEIPRQPRRGVPPAVSTQGLYMGGRPAEPGVRGLLPEAPGVDVIGAGPGRRFRGGARVGPPEPPAAEPIVRGEQTVTPTGRPRGLFGDEPSNVLRRQRLAPDFVGPPEPVITPEGRRLLPPGPDVALPPGGGPLVTEVRPGEPGGLGPFRQADIVPRGRPGVPARVRERPFPRQREIGDPSEDLLTQEPIVRREAPIEPEVLPAERPVEREMTFEEAEAAGKVKVVRPPKTRKELGRDWYREGSLEGEISEHGGLELDLTLEEHARMLMTNINARTQARSHSMFDPIRARKGEKGLKPDEMLQVLQDEGKVPDRWTLNDFIAALTDRQKVTPEGEVYKGVPALGMEETADIFAMMEREGARRLELPEAVKPEVPRRRREIGEPPRTVEEVEADWERRRQEIREMEESGQYPRSDFNQLRLDNDLIRQQELSRLRFGEREPAEPTVTPEAEITERGAERYGEPLNPKVEGLVDRLNREGIETELSGDAYGNEYVYVDVGPQDALASEVAPRLPEGWGAISKSITAVEEWLGKPLTEAQQRSLEVQKEHGIPGVRLVRRGAEPVSESDIQGIVDAIKRGEEFPERVGMEVEEPTVREPDIEGLRQRGAGVRDIGERIDPERVAGYEADLAEAASKERKPTPSEELPIPPDVDPATGREIAESPAYRAYWEENAGEYGALSDLVDRIDLEGLSRSERARAEDVRNTALRRLDEIDEGAADLLAGPRPAEPTVTPEGRIPFAEKDRVIWRGKYGTVERVGGDLVDQVRVQMDDGTRMDIMYDELAPAPPKPVSEPGKTTAALEPEPEVTPEGQVEIVGHEGFLRQNRLADDKAALERLLTARPDPTTEAGKRQIIELGKRERALRQSIAQQERELRGEGDIEQVGMFGEEEPLLFEREPTPAAEKPAVEPPTPKAGERAMDYVDTLKQAASKPGNPVTPELASYAEAYLDWKLGGQTEPPPRMPGVAAKGFRDVIDSLVESDLPPSGGQSTLYMNPIQPAMEWWSKRAGPRLYKYLFSTKEPYGLVVKPWPEPMKWLFINRHRQPAKWVERHQEWERRTEQGALDAFELGKTTTRKLSQQEQQLLGDLLQGRASEKELRAMRENPEWQTAIDAIKTARAKFDEYGALSAEQKLLQEETFFLNHGKYMPRLYRRYELDYDAELRKWGARKPTRLDQDRYKKRQDIPEEVRILRGEILEPGYPIAKGLAQIIHDVETMKLFNFVAKNETWTFEPETLFDLGKDPGQYTLMPTTTKLGPLSGKYVDKYIASELNQMTKARGEMEKVSKRLVSEWKFNKVIFNPATHGRNMISNTMLAYLSGLPPWRVDIYGKALKELYRQEGEYYQAAKDAGLFSTTFAKGELAPLIDSWNSANGGLYDRIAGMQESMAKGEVAEGLGKVLPSGTRAGQRAAKIYQGEEAWFKLAKFIQEMENGRTPKQAAAQAQKALFDYTEVPPFVKWARTSPIGAPFLTFTYKALPQILETGITHPWRLASLVAGIYTMEELARRELGIEEDQMEYLKRIAPDRMKGEPLGLGPKALLLPFVDKYDQLQYLDLTYILPWGDLGETGATGVYQGSPIHAGPMRALYEISINKSAFTGQEIYGENDSKTVVAQKISDHLYKWAMPSLAPPIPGVSEGGYGFERVWKSVWGQEDYFGRVSAPTTAIASAIIGLKTNPLNPDIELFFRVDEFEDGMDEINSAAYKVQNHQGLSEEEKVAQLEELRERARVLEEIYREMIYGAEPQVEQPAAPQPRQEPQVQPER